MALDGTTARARGKGEVETAANRDEVDEGRDRRVRSGNERAPVDLLVEAPHARETLVPPGSCCRLQPGGDLDLGHPLPQGLPNRLHHEIGEYGNLLHQPDLIA